MKTDGTTALKIFPSNKKVRIGGKSCIILGAIALASLNVADWPLDTIFSCLYIGQYLQPALPCMDS